MKGILGNCLISAWRGIQREPFFAAVNVCGLAVGLACCVLMLLFVRHETGYDTQYRDAGRLYHVGWVSGEEGAFGGRLAQAGDFPYEILEQLRATPGGGIDALVGYYQSEDALHFAVDSSSAVRSELYAVAGAEFFQLLQRPFIAGNAQDALSTPESAVITRSLAESLYGTPQVLGRVLTSDKGLPYVIHGVIEDFPVSSHIQRRLFTTTFEVMGMVRNDVYIPGPLRRMVPAQAFIRLSPAADIDAVMERLNNILDTAAAAESLRGVAGQLRARPLPDMHLEDETLLFRGSNGQVIGSLNNRNLILAAAFLAFLVLGVAVANFVNMTVARSQQRRREIATRKAFGAGRLQLIAQYLTEAVVLTFIAFVVAIALVELLLPGFNAIVERTLTTDALFQPAAMGALVLLVASVGLVAGLYPAWVLSGLPAVATQTGSTRTGGMHLRKVLIFGQFLVTGFLVVIALTAHRQLELFRDTRFGYDTNLHVATVGVSSLQAFVGSNLTTDMAPWHNLQPRIRSGLESLPAVAGVAISAEEPGRHDLFHQRLLLRVDEPGALPVVPGAFVSVDDHFLPVLELPLLAGRNFSARYGADRLTTSGGNVLLTVTAARRLGFHAPSAAVGARLRAVSGKPKMREFVGDYTVIGVTGDMSMGDNFGRSPAGVFLFNPVGHVFSIKPRPGRETEAAEQVRAALKRLVPSLVISVEYLPDRLARTLRPMERVTRGFVGYTLLAIMISCLGLYAMTAFVIARRTREVGVRKALGATTAQLTGLLGWDLTCPVVLALLVALPAGYYAGNYLLQPFAERVTIGVVILGFTVLLSLGVAWMTVLTQSYQLAASRPNHLLRYE